MHDQFLRLLKNIAPLTNADTTLCTTYFEPVLYPKNRVIEEAGIVPKYLYFVLSGYVRLFYYDDVGNEVTTHINCPPGFITSYFSFLHQTEAKEYVECVTESALLRITKPHLDALFEQSAALKAVSINVFQESLAYNEQRANDMATLTAEERYRKLIAKQPDIVHNVPIQYIASFLGMKPESLSRIRRKILA